MRKVVRLLLLALAFSLLAPTHEASAAFALDGVGVSQNGLQLFFDVTNYAGISGSTLKDLSGNSRDATITSISSQPSTSTSNGGYLSFNGNGGYATVGSYSFPTYSGFSVSFYANFGTSADNFERIIDFGSGSQSNNIEVGRVGTSSDFFVEAWSGNTSPGWCRANGSIDSGWHFWVVTIGGGYCNIYKDNTQLTTNAAYSSLPTAGSWTNMFIGKSNWADAAFEGGIAELAFYNRVIDSTERTQNYNAAVDQTAPTYTGAATFSPNENQTSVGSISTSEAVTIIPLNGTGDTSYFSLSGSTISFTGPHNYEAPAPSNSMTFYFKIMDLNGNQGPNTYVLTINIQNLVESTSLSTPTFSATAYKGIPQTITVTPSGDGTSIPGKVSYYFAGKRIVGCYKKSYSGTGNSTCTWEPTVQGNREISVIFTPTNTSFTSATSKKSVFVYRRTTLR